MYVRLRKYCVAKPTAGMELKFRAVHRGGLWKIKYIVISEKQKNMWDISLQYTIYTLLTYLLTYFTYLLTLLTYLLYFTLLYLLTYLLTLLTYLLTYSMQQSPS